MATRLARTAHARRMAYAKAGHLSQEEMNNRDIIRAASTPPHTAPIPRYFNTWQKLRGGRFHIGNVMRSGNEYHYILVDLKNDKAMSGWLTAFDVYAILFLDWLFSGNTAA